MKKICHYLCEKKIEKWIIVRVKRQEEVKMNGDNHFVISKKQRGCGFEYEILSRVSHSSDPTTAYDYYFIQTSITLFQFKKINDFHEFQVMEFNQVGRKYTINVSKLIIFNTNQFKVELIFLFERYLSNEAKLKLEHFPSIHRFFSTGADH